MGEELERRPAAPALRAQLPALTIDELARVAQAFAKSGLFGLLNKAPNIAQATSMAFTVLLVGQELGIATGQAMSNIHIIDGKPTFSAALLGALVKRHPGYDYRVLESDDEHALIEWYELNG